MYRSVTQTTGGVPPRQRRCASGHDDAGRTRRASSLGAAAVAAGAGHLAGQAAAIVLVTPFRFAANKLWAFAEAERPPETRAAPVSDRDRARPLEIAAS
jgi:hypothetical protein